VNGTQTTDVGDVGVTEIEGVNTSEGGDVGEELTATEIEGVNTTEGGDVGDLGASESEDVNTREGGDVGDVGASENEGVDGSEWGEVGGEVVERQIYGVVITEGVEWREIRELGLSFVFHGGPEGAVEALDGLWWAVEGTNDGVHCWECLTETLDVERVEVGSDVEPEFDGEMVVGGHGGKKRSSDVTDGDGGIAGDIHASREVCDG
jgi:hypothetical protein